MPTPSRVRLRPGSTPSATAPLRPRPGQTRFRPSVPAISALPAAGGTMPQAICSPTIAAYSTWVTADTRQDITCLRTRGSRPSSAAAVRASVAVAAQAAAVSAWRSCTKAANCAAGSAGDQW